MIKIIVACLVLGLLGIVMPAAAADSEDATLTSYFHDYLDRYFRLRPYMATRLGDHRFDDQLDDLSAAARQRWVDLAQQTLTDLPHRVGYAQLSRNGQIDYEIFEHDLKRTIWMAANVHPYEDDPRAYNEIITDGIFLLLTQSSLSHSRNVRNAVSRMGYIPRIVTAARANLKNPPRVFLETAIKQNRGAIAFFDKAIFEVAGETPQVSDLASACRPVVAALREYQDFLEKDLAARATGDWRLGRERFEKKIDLDLNAGLSADQIVAEAEAEFARVEREMYVIARQLWGTVQPGKPLPPDDESGRVLTIRQVFAKVNQQHDTVDRLVADAKTIVAQVKDFIRDRRIIPLPDPDRCQVIEMPEFQRGNTVAYLNPAPALDPAAASIYAISPPPRDWDARQVESYLEEYNRSMLQILTIHEGYPGHYVQLEYSNRCPSLVRRVLYSGVFAEGWAVYSEQMMLDQGYGGGDLALRLNQLKWYLRSVTNAILDHKMHCTSMSDQEAYQLLTGRAFQTEGEALGKIIRAKQNPCQLSEYFVGRTAFYHLRQQIEREEGDSFDLSRYHQAVLAHGTLPVKYLPELARKTLAK
jgi:uncharacterized protein (DUF885 family)